MSPRARFQSRTGSQAPLQTEALTLRCLEFSETSQVVELATPGHGRVRALAKGARRPRAGFEGGLDILTRGTAQVYLRKHDGLDVLASFESQETFPRVRSELARLKLGYWLIELLLGLLVERQPAAELFSEACDLLRRLEDDEEPDRARALFECRTLLHMGVLPQISRCVRCGRSLSRGAEAASRSAPVRFVTAQGGWVCPDCEKPQDRALLVQAGTLASLATLAQGGVRADRLRLSATSQAQLRRVLDEALLSQLGRIPASYRWLRQD